VPPTSLLLSKQGISLAEFARLARCNGAACDVVSGEDSAVDEFREAVLANATGRHGDRGGPCCEYICCNYDRRALGQTGQGHFSPIAGYDEVEDLVLVLDVARFKYPPHWVRLAVSLLLLALLLASSDLDLLRAGLASGNGGEGVRSRKSWCGRGGWRWSRAGVRRRLPPGGVRPRGEEPGGSPQEVLRPVRQVRGGGKE